MSIDVDRPDWWESVVNKVFDHLVCLIQLLIARLGLRFSTLLSLGPARLNVILFHCKLHDVLLILVLRLGLVVTEEAPSNWVGSADIRFVDVDLSVSHGIDTLLLVAFEFSCGTFAKAHPLTLPGNIQAEDPPPFRLLRTLVHLVRWLEPIRCTVTDRWGTSDDVVKRVFHRSLDWQLGFFDAEAPRPLGLEPRVAMLTHEVGL